MGGRTINRGSLRPGSLSGWPVARRNGVVAQLGERVVRNDEVSGSIPLNSTIRPDFRLNSR
jgi:hypothetical protein